MHDSLPSDTSPRPTILTSRLTLVAGSPPLVQAAARSGAEVAARLNISVAHDWPPPYLDDAWAYLLKQFTENPATIGFSFWFIVRGRLDHSGDGGPATLIGTAGFKGMPNADGDIEVGYGLVASQHCQGLAPEATLALIDLAFSRPEVRRVLADTFPDHYPSISVMRKCGMVFLGDGPIEDGRATVRYGIDRETWAQQRRLRGCHA